MVLAGSVEGTPVERSVPARLLGGARREGKRLLREVGDVGPGMCDVGLPIWDGPGDIDLADAADGWAMRETPVGGLPDRGMPPGRGGAKDGDVGLATPPVKRKI